MTVVVRLVVFSALAYVAFVIGRDTVMASANLSVIWPLSGIGLLWLTSGGRRLWLLDAASLGVVAVVATLIDIPDAPRGGWIMAAILTVLQPVVYVLVMRRVAPDLWGSGGTRAMSTLARPAPVRRGLPGRQRGCGPGARPPGSGCSLRRTWSPPP